ncbi:DNA-binding response regulator [Sphaerisporangium krabiense]|uniref:DNA-binding NarL/FixJ family response regulator n=1 Tax=Sphaerisporangium krabiense TaxID=763782 RepID=A0A7W9DN95_9ACTN|nr:response regulator transcription factor [Sphaerisporangium krabiense]MBB5625191.1 DNA-binding NarL/FixJ family response regulator [Sphaerisporangium krabiense]GII64301.1 DNA-binding response regulator [Sphaerisporangium krabiense]
MTGPAAGGVGILIADDQAMIRAGLRLVIGTQPDLSVLGEASDGERAVELARSLRPDVVLLDIAMPRVDGLEAARRILAAPEPPRVIMLTTYDTDENLDRALHSGVSGFLLKVSPPEHLFAAIRSAARGDMLLDPTVTRRVIDAYRRAPAPPATDSGLTAREEQVLRLVAQGLSNAEIATALFISHATVSTHINRLLAKLSLRDRAQAVRYAYESGVVRPGAPEPD